MPFVLVVLSLLERISQPLELSVSSPLSVSERSFPQIPSREFLRNINTFNHLINSFWHVIWWPQHGFLNKFSIHTVLTILLFWEHVSPHLIRVENTRDMHWDRKLTSKVVLSQWLEDRARWGWLHWYSCSWGLQMGWWPRCPFKKQRRKIKAVVRFVICRFF